MARCDCPRVFPNYDARFRFPGKIGQVRLFRATGTRHPASRLFSDLQDYQRARGHCAPDAFSLQFPRVFKFDWGGEGETVFRIETAGDLDAVLQKAADFERCGQKGFLLQRMVAAENRSLRVAVIGGRRIAYWRVGRGAEGFHSAVSRGARIDYHSDRPRQQTGVDAVNAFCRQTGVNLAGFDLIFEEGQSEPWFLEINWYFGRRGLGGSEAYYAVLLEEIEAWLQKHGLK